MSIRSTEGDLKLLLLFHFLSLETWSLCKYLSLSLSLCLPPFPSHLFCFSLLPSPLSIHVSLWPLSLFHSLCLFSPSFPDCFSPKMCKVTNLALFILFPVSLSLLLCLMFSLCLTAQAARSLLSILSSSSDSRRLFVCLNKLHNASALLLWEFGDEGQEFEVVIILKKANLYFQILPPISSAKCSSLQGVSCQSNSVS